MGRPEASGLHSESESVETDLRSKLIKLCSTLFRCHEVHDYLVENLEQLIGQARRPAHLIGWHVGTVWVVNVSDEFLAERIKL